jgi:sigma-B regulation protein RsbU (phosphoserine phosphatase)
MKVLLAEDDPVSRHMLQIMLSKWGHEVLVNRDGQEAWDALHAPNAPRLAILDWMMPVMDGVEICRKLRAEASREASAPGGPQPTYIILLTAKARKEEIVEGLNSGADDYITKPFDSRELLARLNVGQRILELQSRLAQRVDELEKALAHVKALRGLLPICAWCHKIRDDHDYWQSVETYITDHSDARFSHGICPECFEKVTSSVDGPTETLAAVQ